MTVIRDVDAFIAEMTTEIDRWESGADAAAWSADGSHEDPERVAVWDGSAMAPFNFQGCL